MKLWCKTGKNSGWDRPGPANPTRPILLSMLKRLILVSLPASPLAAASRLEPLLEKDAQGCPARLGNPT